MVEEATGETTRAEGFDWDRHAVELSNMILNDARFGTFFGLPGSENNTSAVTGSQTVLEAVDSSSDAALKSFFSRPRQVSQAIQRVRSAEKLPPSAAILGKDSSSPFESAGSVTREEITRNLDADGIKRRLDSVESKLNMLTADETGSAKTDRIKNDVLQVGQSRKHY